MTPPRSPGLIEGFTAPLRGVGRIARTPSLWPLAMTPFALLIALIVGFAVGARSVFARIEAWALGWIDAQGFFGSFSRFAIDAVVFIVLAVIVLGVATLLTPLLAAPFMDVLTGRLDARKSADEPFTKQLARSVRVALAGFVLVGLPQLVCWVLSIAIPPLAWILGPIGITIASFGLAYDALDWPLARRGLGVRERLRWMRKRPALTVGLGLSVWILSIVPGLSIVLLPAIVAGGVSLVNATETA